MPGRPIVALVLLALVATGARAESDVTGKPAIAPPAQVSDSSAPVVEPVRAPEEDPIAAQWAFLRKAAADPNADLEVVATRLEVLLAERPKADTSAEAQAVLAAVEQKTGDWRRALVTRLHLIYEFPDAPKALEAKSDYLDLASSKLPRSTRAEASGLLRLPESDQAADRLAELVERLSGSLADPLYDAAAAEARGFLVRFPGHPKTDRVLWAYARMHEQARKWTAALLAYQELLAVHPGSELRPKAQLALGDLYGEHLKDYHAAIAAYQEFVQTSPSASDAVAAYGKMADLFERKLEQYPLAVEMDQKIAGLAPKTPTALDALHDAAKVARKDLKDHALEIKFLEQIAEDYPQSKDGPAALFDAAQVYEDDLKDPAKALATYQDVVSKFPESKQAKKAAKRAQKLRPKP